MDFYKKPTNKDARVVHELSRQERYLLHTTMHSHTEAAMESLTDVSSKPFNKLVFKPHTHKRTINKDLLAQLDAQLPQKTIACQRCRKLRKKCSKHLPACSTCLKMGEDCEYMEKTVLEQFKIKRRRDDNTELLPSLKDQLSANYTHNKPALPALSSHLNNQLPPITLPRINHAQLQKVKLDKEVPKQSNQSPNIDIQHALLSTLIDLGKHNLAPRALDTEPLMISQEHALRYAESFFENFYTLAPFLRRSQFLQSLQTANLFNVLNPPQGATPFELRVSFRVYLVLNVGYKNLTSSGLLSNAEVKAHSHVFTPQRIIEWITRSLSFRTNEDIECMALLVIDSFFTKNCLSTSNLTNLLTGLVLRYHYHRRLSSREASKMTSTDIEMRYRLFWTVYTMDRTVANYLNKPVSIPDELVSTPRPKQISEDPAGFEDTVNLMIELKRLEGEVFNKVHSVAALNHGSAQQNNTNVLAPLRAQIEDWFYSTTKPKVLIKSRLLLTTVYYNSLTLLYRPSYLVPRPDAEIMTKLSKAVLQNLTYTYNLTLSKAQFSINWLSLFRILIIFKTLLKCLQDNYIVLEESKTEINLCVEILNNYQNDNEDWNFIKDIVLIFQRLLKLSFQVASEQDIAKEVSYGVSKLELILKENSVGCRLDDRLEEEYDL